MVTKIALGVAGGICLAYVGYLSLGWLTMNRDRDQCIDELTAEFGHAVRMYNLATCMKMRGYESVGHGNDMSFRR